MTDQTTDQTTATAPESTAPQLQLQDIVIAAQAISTASSRGAFRPEEFSRVGGAYDRILSFLQASGALNQTAQTDAAPQGN